MNRKYTLFILVLIVLILVNNVECWSRKTKRRNKPNQNNQEREKYRQKSQQSRRNRQRQGRRPSRKEQEEEQDQEQEINQRRRPQNVVDEDEDEYGLKYIEEELNTPVDPDTGMPLKDKQRYDEQIKSIDESLQEEQDQSKKQELIKQRREKIEEMNEYIKSIQRTRQHLLEMKAEILEEMQMDEEEKIERNEQERIRLIKNQHERKRAQEDFDRHREERRNAREKYKEEREEQVRRHDEKEKKRREKQEDIDMKKEKQFYDEEFDAMQKEYERLKKEREDMKKSNEDIKEENVADEDNDMSAWLEDWEKHMKDFKADEMLSFEVAPKSFEVFFEDIDKPCSVRGAYFLNFDSKDGIDLKIFDPKNQEVHATIGKRQGIFNFEAKETGSYSFYFQNRRSSNKKTVAFVVDVSDNENHLTPDHVDQVKEQVMSVEKQLRSQLSEYKILRRKDRSIDKGRKSNATKIFVFSLIETLVIIGCTVFQVMYIKKILDNRSFV